jgi:hypothetical protein
MWKEFTNSLWNLLYDKMVYRELQINGDTTNEKELIQAEIEEKTEEFINETQNKKYVLSCSAILCYKKKDYERKNNWKDSKGFFCSQLIAAAYLNCGILQYKKGTSYYLPGSFSHGKKLQLKETYSLGPEVIIDFST